LSIPEGRRPHKGQPFYHLLAENSDSENVAYSRAEPIARTIPAIDPPAFRKSRDFVKDKSASDRPPQSFAELKNVASSKAS